MVQDARQLHDADIQLSTGVRLHYAEQGHADGHPMILLHGYSDASFSFSRVLPLLPATYHVFALDQRGHGNSQRPAQGYAMADFAADVIAFECDQSLWMLVIKLPGPAPAFRRVRVPLGMCRRAADVVVADETANMPPNRR